MGRQSDGKPIVGIAIGFPLLLVLGWSAAYKVKAKWREKFLIGCKKENL